MNNFAIPGLMTAPVSPKAATRLQPNADGSLRTVLFRDPAGTARCSLLVVRRQPGGKLQKIIDDPRGAQIFRLHTPTGWDYVWRYDALSPKLPAGDLEVWLRRPGQPDLVFTASIPDVQFTDEAYAFPGAAVPAPSEESDCGIATIPLAVSFFHIPFHFRFEKTPVSAYVTPVGPAGDVLEFVTVNGVDWDRDGMRVALSSPLSVAGSQVAWSAKAAGVPRDAENQSGQRYLDAGTQTVRVTFPVAFAAAPVVTCSLFSPQNGGISVLRHVIHSVTPTSFRLQLSAPIARDMLLNWEAAVTKTDERGRVVIPAGETLASVVFATELDDVANITGNLEADDATIELVQWKIIAPTTTGFSVRLDTPCTVDTTFHWRRQDT